MTETGTFGSDRALVVDDEEDIGFMISKFLRSEGLDADYADNVSSARRKITEGDYKIVFLDLNLTDGTGFDLMDDIRSMVSEARVVVISAYDGVAEMQRIKETGVDLFIKKPFTKSQVINAVQRLLH